MRVQLSEIFVGDRIREDYGDLTSDKASLMESGQLQAILIRHADDKDETDLPWVLVDGGRRYQMFTELLEEGKAPRGMELGLIEAIDRESGTPLQRLQWEFQANDNRKEFTWQEKAKYVKLIHEMCVMEALNEDYDWTVYMTASFLRLSEPATYKYLQLTQDVEIFEDPTVQKSDTFNTAYKKAGIAREKKRRISEAKQHEIGMQKQVQKASENGEGEQVDVRAFHHKMADVLCRHSDAREYVKIIKDESIDFIHWDPPYGNRGFAYSTHEYFEDDWLYASTLMRAMFAEAHRILKDGHWMVVWHTPHKADWVKRALQGHKLGVFGKGDKFSSCVNCGSLWEELDDFTPCRKPENGAGFWVNPIPYIWYKPNRQADGHEIKRFSLHQYEPYFLAAKWEKREPILVDSDSSNVHMHPIVPKSERRHPTHKPAGLLAEVVKRISVPGELGVDFGIGSGSIYEACIPNNRRIVGCDIDEGNWATSHEVVKRVLQECGITSMGEMREKMMAS
jgi:DNA modification methylase